MSEPRQPFLAWLIENYWGPPPDGRLWPCPLCGHRAFGVRPSKPGFKDRWRCWACGAWGDEMDFLKLVHPNERFPLRLERFDALHDEWESDAPANLGGDSGSIAAKRPMDPRDVESAFADVSDELTEDAPSWATGNLAVWRTLAHAAEICYRHNVSLEEVARRCAQGVLHYLETEREHSATCTDPECLAALKNGGNGDVE